MRGAATHSQLAAQDVPGCCPLPGQPSLHHRPPVDAHPPTCRHCCARQMPARVADARTSVCSSSAALQCTRRAMEAPTCATRSCSGEGSRDKAVWAMQWQPEGTTRADGQRLRQACQRCIHCCRTKQTRPCLPGTPLAIGTACTHLLGVVGLGQLWGGQQLRHALLAGGHRVHGVRRAAGAGTLPAGRGRGRGGRQWSVGSSRARHSRTVAMCTMNMAMQHRQQRPPQH